VKKIILIIIAFFIINLGHSAVKDSLTNKQVENLSELCKVWGFLKYYHPEVKSNTIHWDSILWKYTPKVVKTTTNEEFNANILSLLNELSPLAGSGINLKEKQFDPLFSNLNFEWINSSKLLNPKNISELNYIIENYRPYKSKYPNEFYSKAFWEVKYENKLSFECTPIERNYIIAFNYWNFVNFYFPSKALMDKDWSTVLKKLIQDCYKNPTEIKYIISKTHALLNDGYANSNFLKTGTSPFQFNTINDSTFVSAVNNSKLFFKVYVGDQVLELDKVKIEKQREIIALHTSGATKLALSSRIDKRLPLYTADSKEITIKDYFEIVKTVSYADSILKEPVNSEKKKKQKKDKTKSWKILEQTKPLNCGYVDFKRLKLSEVNEVMKKLKKTDAMIMDFRTYPQHASRFLKYLQSSDKIMYEAYYPIFEYPGAYRKEAYKQSPNKFSKFKYPKPVIVLIDENTSGYAETMALSYQTYENVTIIGRNSAAANGPLMSMVLPENIKLHFSAIGISFPNGEQFQRKGVSPKIYVPQTVTGMQNRKDEIFEAAIDYLKQIATPAK